MTLLRAALSFLFVYAALTLPCFGQTHDISLPQDSRPVPLEICTKDRMSFQLVSGLIFSPTAIASRSPVLSYWMTNLRMGWMINDPPPESKSFFRGNFELVLEVTNSVIFEGFGNYLRGFTVLLRRNFVRPDLGIIPYIQVGAGIVNTDAYKDLRQNAIGQATEFTPQGSFGVRCPINRHLSLDAEAMFHHISNARLAKRNGGINAFGGVIGLTYFTDWFWKH